MSLKNSRVLDDNLGLPSSPQIDPETGNVYIEYVNGTAQCGDSGVWTTRIDFICPDSPDEVRVLGCKCFRLTISCRFTIVLPLSIAAPRTVLLAWSGLLTSHAPMTTITRWLAFVSPSCIDYFGINTLSQNCELLDEFGEVLYDLKPLTRDLGHEYSVTVTQGLMTYKYLINVCGATVTCSDDAGICQTAPVNPQFAMNLGAASSAELQLGPSDSLVLTYSGGDKCHSGIQRSAAINFHCNLMAGVGAPKFGAEPGNCTYIFNWETMYACKPQVWPNVQGLIILNYHSLQTFDCKISYSDGQKLMFFDLSSLISDDDNYVVDSPRDNGKSAIQLNVCRPLVQSKATQACSALSASCDTSKTSQGGLL